MAKLEFANPGFNLEGTAKTNIKKGQKVRVDKKTKTFSTISVHTAKIVGIAIEEIKEGEKGEVFVPMPFFKNDSHIKIEGDKFL